MKKEKCIVIGAGFGGIAAALRMQALGFEVTILEKRDKPGGRAYVYYDEGFTFDAGPTVITAPEDIDVLFELFGKKRQDYVEFLRIDPMYRLCWEDGTTFDYYQDEEKILEEIRKISPDDIDGYREYFAYTEKVFKRGYEDLCHVPFLQFRDMVKIAPDLLKLKAYQSVYKTVSTYIKDWRLRQAFSFSSLLIGGNPFRVSSIYTLIHPLERKWGVHFPRGGTHALVQALLKLFEENGGEILCSQEVKEIVVSNKKVKGVLTDRGLIHCKHLISNADVTFTYTNLLRNEKSLQTKFKRFLLNKAQYSMSLYVLYFGTNRKFEQITHHNVLFCSRYQSLLKDIFDKGNLAADFSLYLHAPSLSDPSLAPEGMQSFYVLAPVPHLGKCDPDWTKMGDEYGEKILSYLEENYMPGLRKSIVTKRWFGPNGFRDELNTHHGSAFSLEPRLSQSAYFRVHNVDPNVEGLYFVGAGTHPGAGVPGVIGSARATVDWIAENRAASPRALPVSATES